VDEQLRPEKPRRARGVRLSDLDRSRVYRIGYVGRRWEVLGEDRAGGTGASQMAAEGGRPEAEPTAGAGRHRDPFAPSPEGP
jgi:hypothetical protein